MDFEFQHKGGFLYIFTAHGEDEYDPNVEYILNLDTYTLEVGEQFSSDIKVYVLPKDVKLDSYYETHASVFEYLYNWAYAPQRVDDLPTMDSVLKDGIQDALQVGNALRFGDEWEVCVNRLGDGEADVHYLRWDTLAAVRAVRYPGRKLVQNVWAALFPERFKMDAAEEKALAIAELEDEVRAARLTLELKAEELKRLQNG